MAKVNITVEIDTEKHMMDVKVNGKTIPDANYVSIYKYHNSYEDDCEVSCNITSTTKDEEARITTTTNYYTHASAEAKKIAKADQVKDPLLPDFIGKVDTDHSNAIAKFFERNLSL